MEVTYTSSRADHWRCNLYILAHKPLQIGLLLLPPVTLTCLVYSAFYHPPVQPLTVSKALFIALAIFGMFGVYYAGFMAAVIDSIFQSGSSKPDAPGVSTTSLTPEGVRDLTPTQDQLLVWKDVKGIRLHNGDFYRNDFWGWMNEMVFIPGLAVLIVLIGMDFSQQIPLQEKIAVLIALMLFAGWLGRLRYEYRAREAARRIYAVTNERLMILQLSKMSYFAEADLLPIQRALRASRLLLNPKTNTLAFGVRDAPDFAFSHLKCHEDVRQIILGTKKPSSVLN